MSKYDIIEVEPKFKVGDKVDCYKRNITDTEILDVRVGHTVWGEPYITYEIKDGIVLTCEYEKNLCKAKKYVIKDKSQTQDEYTKLCSQVDQMFYHIACELTLEQQITLEPYIKDIREHVYKVAEKLI